MYLPCKSLWSGSPHRRSAPSLAASGWTHLSSSDHLSSLVSGKDSSLTTSWKLGLNEVFGCLRNNELVKSHACTSTGYFNPYQHDIMMLYTARGQPGGGGRRNPVSTNFSTCLQFTIGSYINSLCTHVQHCLCGLQMACVPHSISRT